MLFPWEGVRKKASHGAFKDMSWFHIMKQEFAGG